MSVNETIKALEKDEDDIRATVYSIDWATVISIAAVAWFLVTILHEVVGHGGACVLVGGHVQAVTTTDTFCIRPDPVGFWQDKFIEAGGAIVNFVLAGIAWTILQFRKDLANSNRLFFWLLFTFNAFNLGTYMVIGPLTGIGDWAHFIHGFRYVGLMRALVLVIGAGVIFAAMRFGARSWLPILGDMPEERIRRMWLFTRLPVATAVAMNIAAALVSPLVLRWALPIALGSSLLFLWWMFIVPRFTVMPSRKERNEVLHRPDPPAIPRSWPWLFVGLACIVVFVCIFGHGIGSFAGYVIPTR